MFDNRTEMLRGMLFAHDYVCREIGQAEREDQPDDHVTGLKEARNRIEQAILEHRMDVPVDDLADVDIDADELAKQLDED